MSLASSKIFETLLCIKVLVFIELLEADTIATTTNLPTLQDSVIQHSVDPTIHGTLTSD